MLDNNNLSKIWFILIYTIIFLWLRWHGSETFQFCAQVLLVVAVSSGVVLCLPSPQQPQQPTKVNINNNTASADASTADEFFYDYGNYDERAGKATKTTKVLQIFLIFAGFGNYYRGGHLRQLSRQYVTFLKGQKLSTFPIRLNMFTYT